MPGKRKDLTNQRFGMLVVTSFSHMNKKHSYWNCVCDCGDTHKVRIDCLKGGLVKSCGCLNFRSREYAKTHGQSDSKLYRVFYAMKQRCYDPESKTYKYYGGRGIVICDEWKDNFELFYTWAMRNGYKQGLSIDRINNNGNYEPSNCRWVTQKTQNQNKRPKKRIRNVRCNDYPEREYIHY